MTATDESQPPTHEDAVRRLKAIECLLWDARLLAQSAVFEAARLDLGPAKADPEHGDKIRQSMIVAIVETFEHIESARDEVDSLQFDHGRGVVA